MIPLTPKLTLEFHPVIQVAAILPKTEVPLNALFSRSGAKLCNRFPYDRSARATFFRGSPIKPFNVFIGQVCKNASHDI